MSKSTRKNKGGRPTVITPDVLQKLEDAFMNAFTDEMACLYAGISEAALYEYCQRNKKFAERKELLKKHPNMTAQQTLVGDLKSVGGARWWAEHKMPDFMPKAKLEHSGKVETTLGVSEEAKQIAARYEEEMKGAIKKILQPTP